MKPLVLIAFLLAAPVAGAPPETETASWNPRAAASYLDNRESWWQSWPKSQRDHETACVSCHTVLPFAIGRPALHSVLKEEITSSAEKAMLANVEKRVNLWAETEPYYKEVSGPTKPAESRGTEAILNAFVLANYDARAGHLRDVTRSALEHAWSLQLPSGAWAWLDFHYAPWETQDAQYWGATLMAMAVALAPDHYRDTPAIQAGVEKMQAWLKQQYAHQPLFNRIYLLWTSARVPGLLTPAERKDLAEEIVAHQQADGGWNVASLGSWKRTDNTPLDLHSDGYGTAIAMLALKAAGNAGSSPALERGRAWLVRNQDQQEGSWPATSLIKERDPASDIGHFMRDAATGYASLALE
jgi:squalene-hopene/tetraprenyl-beta-curcumene cyclase